MAFMLGVLPLAISSGAGANSRHAIGTGVLGGMTLATVLAILFIPLFFVVVLRIFKTRRPEADTTLAVTEE
jgi:multidrug efflux pump